MPRIRIARLDSGRYQVAVLANNPSEQPSRLVEVDRPEQVDAGIEQMYSEWKTERERRRSGTVTSSL